MYGVEHVSSHVIQNWCKCPYLPHDDGMRTVRSCLRGRDGHELTKADQSGATLRRVTDTLRLGIRILLLVGGFVAPKREAFSNLVELPFATLLACSSDSRATDSCVLFTL